MREYLKICPKCVPKWIFFFLILIVFKPVQAFSDDEFSTFTENAANSQHSETNDEFAAFDEFESFGQIDLIVTSHESCSGEHGQCKSKNGENLNWVFGILVFTVLAGVFVRFSIARNFRGIFLVASVAILGFYKGACPCPISSMQNLVLAGLGVDVAWQSLIWFLALIPITYLFGRVYCGWICHLGAIQEFIYLPAKIKMFQSEKAQRIMRAIRIVFLIALVIQLFVTKTNLFKHYDPFKVAFNLIGTNTLSWVLLALLLVSSVFIYRPFCKTVCPIGLILGWVNKIPGASVIGSNGNCTGCKTCDNTCKIRAITHDDKFSKLDNQECIACGDCMSNCSKDALHFFRNNKRIHHDQMACRRQDV